MAVDVARINTLVDELGLDDADKDYMLKVLTNPKNEKVAVQFVGQRERHDNMTRRTQELSMKEKDIQRRANEQIAEYAKQLEAADGKIRKIMSDFENESISRATAEARLAKVKEVYNLSDEDVPKVEPPKRGKSKEDAGDGNDGIDIKGLLKEFKKELMAELGPELAAFPRVAAIQNEILAQHLELTGKRLTQKEMEELMKTSQAEGGPSLVAAWREKYDIDKIVKTREREAIVKEERQKWDDELKARNSEDALRQVKSTADGNTKHLSPVLRQYKTNNEPADRDFKSVDKTDNKPVDRTPAVQNEPKLSGAERAAQRFINRRNNGIPMGAPDPVGAGK